MKYSFIDILAGILSAIIASMGLGGGGVYIMYLTLVKNTPQINAQGLNLLFFISTFPIFIGVKRVLYSMPAPLIINIL